DEEGRAEEGGDNANLYFAGRRDNAADHIGAKQEDGRHQHGIGENPAIAGTGDRARDVRDSKADKGDRAGSGGRGASENDRGQTSQSTREANALAQRASDVLTHGEAIEQAGGGEGKDHADQEEGRDLKHDVDVTSGQRADLPKADFIERA